MSARVVPPGRNPLAASLARALRARLATTGRPNPLAVSLARGLRERAAEVTEAPAATPGGAGEGGGTRVDASRAASSPIRFTLFRGARDAIGRPLRAADWSHFTGGLRGALEGAASTKTDLAAIGPFALRQGERRIDAAVEAVTLLALDIDGLPAAELPRLLARLKGVAAAAHTSPSDGGPESPIRKLRIYALPSRPIAPGECRRTRLAFAAMLGVTCDRTALNPSRILFVGRIAGSPPRELWAFEGDPVDVDALLASVPLDSAQAPTREHGSANTSASAAELAGSCVLGRALLARKAVISAKTLGTRAAVVIRCPNADAHDRHGARSTDETAIYLPPMQPGRVGAITCVRTACAGIVDWLPHFRDHELTDAGILLARVEGVYTGNVDSAGRSRPCAVLQCSDLSVRYLRCSEGTPMWGALLAAAYADTPEQAAGAWIGVTVDGEGKIDRVYRVEGPRREPLPEAAE